jgi:hypothetical protein
MNAAPEESLAPQTAPITEFGFREIWQKGRPASHPTALLKL